MLSGSIGRTRRTRGFTLVELMVVLVVIAIGAAMILPEMQGTWDDMLLRSTSRELVGACALAASQAITINEAHVVRVVLSDRRYIITPAGGGVDRGAAPSRRVQVSRTAGELDERIRIEVRIPPGDAIEPPGARLPSALGQAPSDPDLLTFYPDGTADAREVLLRDRGGFGLVLRVNPTTGRVTVARLPRQ